MTDLRRIRASEDADRLVGQVGWTDRSASPQVTGPFASCVRRLPPGGTFAGGGWGHERRGGVERGAEVARDHGSLALVVRPLPRVVVRREPGRGGDGAPGAAHVPGDLPRHRARLLI